MPAEQQKNNDIPLFNEAEETIERELEVLKNERGALAQDSASSLLASAGTPEKGLNAEYAKEESEGLSSFKNQLINDLENSPENEKFTYEFTKGVGSTSMRISFYKQDGELYGDLQLLFKGKVRRNNNGLTLENLFYNLEKGKYFLIEE